MPQVLNHLILELNATRGDVPTDIMLIPAPNSDGMILGADGRWFRNDTPDAVISLWANRDVALQGDYDHRSELGYENDTSACGWVESLYVKDGAIWATVDWTSDAQQKIADRQYRYISPSFFVTEEQKNIVELTSFALTNRPNLALKALNREGSVQSTTANCAENQPHEKETDMDKKQLCQVLDLADDTPDADVLAKIKELNTKQPDKQKQDVDMVPKADYEYALNRANTAEQQLADKATAELNAMAEQAVDDAITAKTIAPATREYHLNNMKSADDIASFKETYANADPIVGATPALNNADATDASGLTAEQRATYTQLNMAEHGVSEEEYVKSLNTVHAN